MSLIFKSLLALSFLTSSITYAAPIPGRGAKVAPKLGVYRSAKGFKINLADSEWIQVKPPGKTRHITTMFRSPHLKNNMRGTLTVRTDKLRKNVNLKKYVNRWTKQYPKFGFDVLGTKKFKLKGQAGYFVDLINKKKKRKLRQVIFMKNRRAVLLTCRDHVDSFKDTLKSCNRLIRGFRWNKTTKMTTAQKRRMKKNLVNKARRAKNKANKRKVKSL